MFSLYSTPEYYSCVIEFEKELAPVNLRQPQEIMGGPTSSSKGRAKIGAVKERKGCRARE